MFKVKLLIAIGGIVMLLSCASVAPYQMMYLNDEDMKFSGNKLESYENAFQSYREGPTGGATGKTGGGCGCN